MNTRHPSHGFVVTSQAPSPTNATNATDRKLYVQIHRSVRIEYVFVLDVGSNLPVFCNLSFRLHIKRFSFCLNCKSAFELFERKYLYV